MIKALYVLRGDSCYEFYCAFDDNTQPEPEQNFIDEIAMRLTVACGEEVKIIEIDDVSNMTYYLESNNSKINLWAAHLYSEQEKNMLIKPSATSQGTQCGKKERGSAVQADREAEIPMKLNDAENAFHRIDASLSILFSRLEPIMRDDVPQALDRNQEQHPRNVSTPIGARVNDLTLNLDSLNKRIVHMIDLIEV